MIPLSNNQVAIFDSGKAELVIMDHRKLVVTRKVSIKCVSPNSVLPLTDTQIIYFDTDYSNLRILNTETLKTEHWVYVPRGYVLAGLAGNKDFVCIKVDVRVTVYDKKSLKEVHRWNVSPRCMCLGIDSKNNVYTFKPDEDEFGIPNPYDDNVNKIEVFTIDGASVKTLTFDVDLKGRLHLHNDVLYLKPKNLTIVNAYSLDGKLLGNLESTNLFDGCVPMCITDTGELMVVEDTVIRVY
jgi:hypothetical protein